MDTSLFYCKIFKLELIGYVETCYLTGPHNGISHILLVYLWWSTISRDM